MAVTNESPKNKSGCAEYCCCCFRRRRQQETTDPTTTPNVSEDNAPTVRSLLFYFVCVTVTDNTYY